MPANELRPEVEPTGEPEWLVYAVQQLLKGIVWYFKYCLIYGILIPYLILWLLIFPCLFYVANLSVLFASLLASAVAVIVLLTPPLNGCFVKLLYSALLYLSVDPVVLHKWVKASIAFVYQRWWDIVAVVVVVSAISFAFS
jgi:hypothetical protein